MGLDIEHIKESYAKKSNDELLYIAKYEMATKRDEVVEVIKNEVTKRGLDNTLIKIINNQTKELTQTEINDLVNLVKKNPCTVCGQSFTPL